jgi:hypothetical protein
VPDVRTQTDPRLTNRTRLLLSLTAVAAILLPVLTIRRIPTPFPDVQLYASIARSVQLYDVGVPTITWNSPTAVDHLPFYGPVFFDLASAAMHLFGPGTFSFRLVSVFSTLLFVGAGALLARHVSGSRDGWLWSTVLLLLTPEVNSMMTAGAMHMLALAFETMALAVFVRGLTTPGRNAWFSGGASGLLLALAALTTPRSYLFIFAFLCAGVLLPWMPAHRRPSARRQFAIAVAVLFATMMAWATVSHGNPVRWFRYMTFIFLSEDTDVAILPTAVRDWSFGWSLVLTPAVAVTGAFLVARTLVRDRRTGERDQSGIMPFALTTTWIASVLTFTVMNLTWNVGEYFGLPLLVVVLAMPRWQLRLDRRLLMAAVGCVIAADLGLMALRYARAAASWAARDPDRINAFMRAHVPPGSEVVGPEAPYFFPVERSGSRYRTVSARSWADWARWVPLIEPDATSLARSISVPAPEGRFFIWPMDEAVPEEYKCVRDHVAAIYRRPPDYLHLLGPLGRPMDRGYLDTVLYRLPPDCPTGYDPTGVHRR